MRVLHWVAVPVQRRPLRRVIELAVAGETYRVTPGDVVVFRGDQKHHYANVGTGEAIAYSVIAFNPLG